MIARIPTIIVPASGLFRLSSRPQTEPYFGKKGSGRFDAPTARNRPEGRFGVCYAASSLDIAFCETILHDGEPTSFDGRYVVPAEKVLNRHLVTFTCPSKPDLTLIDLTGPNLKAAGLNNDISAGSNYSFTQRLSSEIYKRRPEVDGIRYVSRQDNSGMCYTLFDRCGIQIASYAALDTDMVKALAEKYQVLVVPPLV